MEHNKIVLLQDWGCDTQGALERLDGDGAFYLECTQLFCKDENFDQLPVALNNGNGQEAFRCAHTLKGVAANFGLLPLLDAISKVVEPLRDENLPLAQAKYAELAVKKAEYDAIVMGNETTESF